MKTTIDLLASQLADQVRFLQLLQSNDPYAGADLDATARQIIAIGKALKDVAYNMGVRS